jgi:2-polyprenyl-3-methyl-5-hydroxy-6-metoxy-1,4-benzoquinol methylase
MGYDANLVRCVSCGLKFYDKRVHDVGLINNTKAAHQVFDNNLIYGAMNNLDLEKVEYFKEEHLKYYTGFFNILKEFVNPLNTLYEVGTGIGEFLSVARINGINNVSGCEINRRGAEIANEHNDLKVEFEFFQYATVPYELDAIIMSDVIEHTPTPREDFEKAYEHLRKGGGIFIKTFYDEYHYTLPEINIKSVESFSDPNHGYFDPIYHLFHFDQDVLIKLMESVGFEIRRVDLDEAWGQIIIYATK